MITVDMHAVLVRSIVGIVVRDAVLASIAVRGAVGPATEVST